MSTGLFWLTVAGVYLVGAVGTARAVFTHNYKREHAWWTDRKARVAKNLKEMGGRLDYLTEKDRRAHKHDAHYLTVHDSDVYTPTIWSGVLWFVVAPYLLVIKPVGTVVIPMVVKWFTAPARKAVAS